MDSVDRVVRSFAGVELGDPRRTKRVERFVAKIARTPSVSLPAALSSDAEVQGAYRIANNPRVTSMEASMAKAKAGRVANEVTLRCVELCGPLGYGETELLEKWARDSKILDIFEGTQQIQMLIVARRLLDKTSADLR